MSVAILAMEERVHDSAIIPPSESFSILKEKSEKPRLYTGIDDRVIAIKAQAYKDGLTLGRQEGQDQIKSLQEEQELLFKIVTSKSEMNRKLLGDLQQVRENHEELQSGVRAIAQQLVEIVSQHKSFRDNPGQQILKLQKIIDELKKTVS